MSNLDYDPEEITLKSNGVKIKFVGHLLANAKSSTNKNVGNYSGFPDKCEELKLYETVSGRYVCERIIFTGELIKHVKKCKSKKEVIKFFGEDWLASYLYGYAGINVYE